jgi:ABC-2 type transport system permease protein
MPQPRITSVDVTMDIYPEQERFNSYGNYTLANKTNAAIDMLIISNSLDVITNFNINTPSHIISIDKAGGITILKLSNPMMPGDTLILSYSINNIPNTLLHENSLVKRNGTYITSLIYPSIGFRANNSTASPHDSLALNNHYRSYDADYIDFKATVSTANNQTAVAPGYLTNKWVENNRNYFQYRSTSTVTNDYAFVSGDYEIATSQWNNISIEIYHHKTHSQNIDHMLKGIKATLAYCETNFSNYQHKQIRVIEYSRSSGNFAQSFANTIPYSETGFMMDIDANGARGLNLPFIGVSHELAHQWWGMQVIPADVKGAKMITESMAEYVSLKVLEIHYGKSKALEYLEKSMNIYTKNHLEHGLEEPPLMYNTGNDKAYIPYQKGLLAMNTINHYLGNEKLNNALKRYLNKVYRQTAPYTTSIEMVDHLKKNSPDSLKYLIKDLFEDVILYDNKILDAKITRLNNGKFEVELLLDIKKYGYSNSSYSEIKAEDDIIEIGFYKYNSEILPTEVKSIRVNNNRTSIYFTVNNNPSKISIDPYFLLADKNRKDNTKQL